MQSEQKVYANRIKARTQKIRFCYYYNEGNVIDILKDRLTIS